MTIDPQALAHDLDVLEDIERASLRLVVQGIYDFRATAREVFAQEPDLVADIAEDVTRDALDTLGMSGIGQRLYGKMDYKRARYVFHPQYSVKQALLVDSKAEKTSGDATATLQTSQFSMIVRQVRQGQTIEVPGKLPPVVTVKGEDFLTTTIFVKYNYEESKAGKTLVGIRIAAVPNGLLQDRYNPIAGDGIWLAGRNAPTLGEEFRVRLSFAALKKKARWRVQLIPLAKGSYAWDE